jgi:hypothetical protein
MTAVSISAGGTLYESQSGAETSHRDEQHTALKQ